jgi:hypothetical protein
MKQWWSSCRYELRSKRLDQLQKDLNTGTKKASVVSLKTETTLAI